MDRIELSPLERKARTIIEADRDREDTGPGFSIRQSVRNIFVAQWAHALPADKIQAIAEVLGPFKYDKKHFKDELTKFERRKVLRSYVKEGKRLYEVNY
jgi:hypothetical protein